jgi:preprotein translocase subunit SecA
MLQLARVLPLPGPVWGPYPMRPANDLAPPWRAANWLGGLAACRRVERAAAAQQSSWQPMDAGAQAAALLGLRRTLRSKGLTSTLMARALGFVCIVAHQTLGLQARTSQLLAAAALLDNRMAEMATGEGKTLAIGLAAAVAALAGIPVHVVTANDYLATRDAAQLAPLYRALGLSSTALEGSGSDESRRTAYGHDIVYATAPALAFDFLRDRQNMAGADRLERVAANMGERRPAALLMRGLCLALLDEADSILLDEAEVPLILSRKLPQAARRAYLWQALALARQLDANRDFVVHRADRLVELTAMGEERLDIHAAVLGGPWSRPRYRREAVVLALAALHAYHRNEQYLVQGVAIELLDPVSGRVAPGRVWSRGLHTLVALKEGLRPPSETETLEQTTFQRFFQRYWRLGGISGTLREASAELASVYGTGVVSIPLHQPCRRTQLPARRFENAGAMFDAVLERLRILRASGRPVLVGTDSVAQSEQLSELLRRHGVEHRVLSALHAAGEAALVASAGQAGRITVATRMAGRGTDIELDPAARSAGGLHVLSCQQNPSRRLDRQLAGRCARHGDPGSVEEWACLAADGPVVPSWLAQPLKHWTQRREEQRRAGLRANLLEQDLYWESRLAFAGAGAQAQYP